MKLAYDRDGQGIILLPFLDTTLLSRRVCVTKKFDLKLKSLSSIAIIIFVLIPDFYLIIMISFVSNVDT